LFIDINSNSRDNSLSAPTGYGPDDWGLISGKGKIFLLSTSSGLVLRPHPPDALPPEVKQSGREADHSPDAVKITWIYAPTPPYALIAYCSLS
jgi:hypothetical protein